MQKLNKTTHKGSRGKLMEVEMSGLRNEIVNKIIERINSKLSGNKAKLLIKFVNCYYNLSAESDLAERSVDDLYGAVLSHWNFLYQRFPEQYKIRIFNPNYEQHGWQSNHTIIEVVQTNMPFLVDSLRMELMNQGIGIHLMIHPGGINFKRNEKGEITDVIDSRQFLDETVDSDAPIYIEIDQQVDLEFLEQLTAKLGNVLEDVKITVTDWKAMKDKANDIINEFENNPPPLEKNELKESIDFIKWIASNNFTFLGYRDYEIIIQNNNEVLKAIPNSGLGLLRDERSHNITLNMSSLPAKAREDALSPEHVLTILKLSTRSTVHRPSEPYYIGIKMINEQGIVCGERRFIGLYTSAAYNSNPRSIPFLRHKVEAVLASSGFPRYSHSWKGLLNILETFPRDELFQANEDELSRMVLGIFQMQERQRIRLFLRKDPYARFYSALIYVPREKFNSDLREKMGKILCDALEGDEVDFTTQFSESVLARIHFIIKTKNARNRADINEQELESALATAGLTWGDNLKSALFEYYGEANANKLYKKYEKAFSAGYIDYFSARTAVYDIQHMEALSRDHQIGMSLYRPLEGIAGELHFKLYYMDQPVALSDILPMLENMGLRVIGERSHSIDLSDGTVVWITDFIMFHAYGHDIAVDKIRDVFQDAFAKIWAEDVENDGFNRLVLSVGLSWHETIVFRSYAKYLRQIGFTFSQQYIEDTLSKYPEIVRLLITLFHRRFNPKKTSGSTARIIEIKAKIINQLDETVTGLDEDKILRRYLELMMATLRCNYYQKDSSGKDKTYLCLKLNSKDIPEMPLPVPMLEFFVYSPHVEAVHLRSTKIARGGIRWSDRKEDFRTEILGLMKAQQVKNSVIVPSGAKGGFVVKKLPVAGSREDIMQEVIKCYSIFIHGILDLSDNHSSNKIIYPKNVVRHDDDDFYLVVAADKGTATFSDIANQIAKDYHYWLGDAFASGGSAGYDHKKMGITARSAWESVKRHFRELNINIEKTDFTVVGIGDMGGDVFGNGLLLSRHIKLVAAFNHQHIFIDPDPDPNISYDERKRLFQLSRSSWADYNVKCLSKGGGIFNRSAKSIKLNDEIRKVLNLNTQIIIPNDLIKAILKSSVDLLWNGGIGTYVKGAHEHNLDVGDRTNDAVRINGGELNCKVVGEGGNLGFTQLGRVEYQLNGGQSFTDFIDNAGGVDCSDHEVNIKILLDSIVLEGDMTQKQRNVLLAEMTDEVASLVLRNSYIQAQAISQAASRAHKTLDEYGRFIQSLERRGYLDRALEFLPTDEQLSERKSKSQGLTRCELSVLLAYNKTLLKEELLASDILKDSYLHSWLATAFPERLTRMYPEQMREHQLKSEIIATQLSNAINNEMGATFIQRIYDETGASSSAVIRSFLIVRDIFNVEDYWSEIENLDNIVPPNVQMKMRSGIVRLLRRATRWVLRNPKLDCDINTTVHLFDEGVKELNEKLDTLLLGSELNKFNKTIDYYCSNKVPKKMAKKIASIRPLNSALDIVDSATYNKLSVTQVAQTYFALGMRLQLDWFRTEIIRHPVTNNWDALARAACKDDLDRQQRNITESVLACKSDDRTTQDCIEFWVDDNQPLLERWNNMTADLKSTKIREFSMFAVALRELLDLAQMSAQKN